MLSIILPTRDRHEELTLTLGALARLDPRQLALLGGAELLVVDNNSQRMPVLPDRLANGIACRLIVRVKNEGAAARNVAAREARGEWLLMLDDDSAPTDAGFVDMLLRAAPDVAAIGAEILLPGGAHESGGLPEVFIGCGVLIRRDAFLRAGGYDPAFEYYAEEYDLCARLISTGWRIEHDRRFKVEHRKVAGGRDMGRILARLVRNNGWVDQRYAPERSREEHLARTIGRYRLIAQKERATEGFDEGLRELRATLHDQPRREMSQDAFDRFTGLHAAHETLEPLLAEHRVSRAMVIGEGKNDWAVRRAIENCGVRLVRSEREAECLVIGTLSPGPLTDTLVAKRTKHTLPILAPWRWADERSAIAVAGQAQRIAC